MPEIVTFGCRLNAHESAMISDMLRESRQDAVIFNTCAVTKEAERQAKQAIRRYIRDNPGRRVIVTGCAAQIDPQKYASIDGVSLVLGNEEKLRAESYSDKHERIIVNDIMSVRDTAPQFASSMEGRARASLQVQNGCDHRCTFCIIPYGRGNSRSVPVGEITRHTQQLVEQGYNELVITGVDLTSYGADLPGSPTLGQMLRRLLNIVPDLPRLRLSSIDVAEVDDDLRLLIESEPRLMPHMHLSVQAGSDMILKRMKRRHTRAQVIDFCNAVRRVRGDIVFGADIITGFPTETEEMFDDSVRLVEEAGLTYLHIFPYSAREGTPAAKIPTERHVPQMVRKERAAKLREVGRMREDALYRSLIGTTQQVIIEERGDELFGRTAQYCSLTLPSVPGITAGRIYQARVTSYEDGILNAEII